MRRLNYARQWIDVSRLNCEMRFWNETDSHANNAEQALENTIPSIRVEKCGYMLIIFSRSVKVVL